MRVHELRDLDGSVPSPDIGQMGKSWVNQKTPEMTFGGPAVNFQVFF